ncbi:MAG: GNAT family N-acetyltransferase [Hyphomonas sp.]
MKLDAPNLCNSVVRLSLLSEADRAPLADAGGIEAMWNWMPVIPTGTNYDSYFDFMLEMARRGEIFPFTIRQVSDDAFAGVIGFLNISRTHRRLRIGYVWHPEEFRGTAIAPATQMAMLERAKASRMRRVEYLLASDNERAIQAVLKLGATKEGVLRQYLRLADGGWADMTVLSLVDGEINAAISLLQDRVAELQLA